MLRDAYKVNSAPAYMEIHRYRMRKKRKMIVLIGSIGLLFALLIYLNNHVLFGGYRKVILGQTSFEQVDRMFDRNSEPILVFGIGGNIIDTIQDSDTYKALFFDPHFTENNDYATKASVSRVAKLDPIVNFSSNTSSDELVEDEEELMVEEEELAEETEGNNVEEQELEVYIDDESGTDTDPIQTISNADKEKPTPVDEKTAQIESTDSRSDTDEKSVESPKTDVNTETTASSRTDSKEENSKEEDATSVAKTGRVLPSFPGGLEALSGFLKQHVTYPDEAKQNGVEGIVYVNFVVKKDGALSNPQITRGLGHGCDEVVMKLIDNMPKWVPGSKNGEKVDMSYTLPISFRAK